MNEGIWTMTDSEFAAELRKAKAEALRQAADELEYGNPVAQFLYDRATDIAKGAGNE